MLLASGPDDQKQHHRKRIRRSAKQKAQRTVTKHQQPQLAEELCRDNQDQECGGINACGAPTLWQRGIALYIAGKYDECAAQFAAFFAEDPSDLENAAWHFFCVARARSIERARTERLQAGPDPRILRQQIDEMLSGQRTPDQLLDLAGRSVAIVQFYGHLYVGLYMDASGHRAAAIEHLTMAADPRYDAYGGFMNVVAKVYVERLRRN